MQVRKHCFLQYLLTQFNCIGNVVLEKVRDKLRRKSWAYFLQRRKIRQEYIQLYKSFAGAKWVSLYSSPFSSL